MVRFIRQEAEEKANEILVSAEEEFNIRSCNWLRQRRRRSGKSMSVKRSKFKFAKRLSIQCSLMPLGSKCSKLKMIWLIPMKDGAWKGAFLNVSQNQPSLQESSFSKEPHCSEFAQIEGALLSCYVAGKMTII
ncbi:hypothetical protein NC653_030090 [Populus alba x Populus x berolinensis]|uniref:Uncharacterized protein n=1 Tax=Populus alba x Populus x berolinensis TaxID=444605 RepID=A0AAD6Q019_9ROSI|nr:hypothetical protein NC653_030090 [Populus alba x Populus x berolinensis]